MTVAANIVLDVSVETLNSFNQSCSSSAQATVDVVQEEGGDAVCERLSSDEVGARISNVTIDQKAQSASDCVMVAGSAQQKHLMSEALRERFTKGVARFVASTAENSDVVTAVNQIADTLATESFSKCYTKAMAAIKLAQENACLNIIDNVDITQKSKAVTRSCLIEGLAASGGELGLDLMLGRADEGGEGGEGGGACLLPVAEWVNILLLAILGIAVVACAYFVLQRCRSEEKGAPGPAAAAPAAAVEAAAAPAAAVEADA